MKNIATKLCKKCNQTKSKTFFPEYGRVCKECRKKNNVDWYAKKTANKICRQCKKAKVFKWRQLCNECKSQNNKTCHRQWCRRNPEKRNKSNRDSYQKHRTKRIKTRQTYYLKNKEKIDKWYKKANDKARKLMNNSYIKSLIYRNSFIKSDDIPDSLVKAKRLHLVLNRLKKEKDNNKKLKIVIQLKTILKEF